MSREELLSQILQLPEEDKRHIHARLCADLSALQGPQLSAEMLAELDRRLAAFEDRKDPGTTLDQIARKRGYRVP